MSSRNPAVALRFADNLRGHRRRIGVSQDHLAKWTGLHRTEISLLERGLREPRAQTIVKLAVALDVSADALLDGIGWKLPREGPRGEVTISPERQFPEDRHGAIVINGKPS